ncbi:hypothetical protein D3C76_1711800 [compost metagenome]
MRQEYEKISLHLRYYGELPFGEFEMVEFHGSDLMVKSSSSLGMGAANATSPKENLTGTTASPIAF